MLGGSSTPSTKKVLGSSTPAKKLSGGSTPAAKKLSGGGTPALKKQQAEKHEESTIPKAKSAAATYTPVPMPRPSGTVPATKDGSSAYMVRRYAVAAMQCQPVR